MKNLPIHIGIIPDGNRRWAKEKELPIFEGHRRGLALVKEVASWCFEEGIRFVSFYGFSTENWKRTKEEIDYLMNKIFKKNLFEKDLKYFHLHNIKILVSGREEKLPVDLRKAFKKAVKLTESNNGGVVNFCLNYGGRIEIIDAVKKIIKKKIPSATINENLFRKNLYHPEVPDPDLIIRTAGEKRLSNFLLWQSAYAELYFIDKYWPDFTKEDLEKAIKDYSKRQRRYGK